MLVEIPDIQDFFLRRVKDSGSGRLEETIRAVFRPTNTLLLQLVEKDRNLLIFFLNIDTEKSRSSFPL